jgi:hypothetical protein
MRYLTILEQVYCTFERYREYLFMTNASTFNITFFPTISTVDFHKRLVLLIVLCCLTSYAPSLFAEDVNKIAAMEASLKTAKFVTSI